MEWVWKQRHILYKNQEHECETHGNVTSQYFLPTICTTRSGMVGHWQDAKFICCKYIYIYMSVCEFQISASQGLFRLFASIFIEWAKLHLPLSHFNLLLQPCYCSLYAIASCTCSCLMNVENLVEELRIRTDAYTIGTFSKWWCKYLFDRLHHNQQIWTHRDSLSCFRLSWTEKM